MSSKITLTLEQLQFMEESHRFTWLNNAQEFLDSLKEGIVEFEEYKQRQKDAEKAEVEAIKAAKKAERDQIAARKDEDARLKRSLKLAADYEKAKKWAENMEKSALKKQERMANSWFRLLKKGSKHLDAEAKEAIKAEKAGRKAQVEAEKAAKRLERETKKAQIEAEKDAKKAAKEAKKKEATEHKRTNKKSAYGIFRSNNTGKGWKPGDFRDAWDKVSEEEKQKWAKMAEEANGGMEEVA
jgi:hypothetical protein